MISQNGRVESKEPDVQLYHEIWRPQVHFTARQWTVHLLNPRERQEGWVNDLNGLIYYDHEYHMFAQRWNRCWIHAISKDLVHWTELEPAFWEESHDSGSQSGTCVIDYDNTSGLAHDKAHPPMVAFWSRGDNRGQCLCYSLDHGRTWTHYAKNPYMVTPERDPKVFWYAPAKHWVMILYGEGQYRIFTSSNLLDWTDQHKPILDSFECPDFFEMPLDGNKHNKKWVLIQGNGQFSIGTFNGTEFKEETKRFPCDIGPNFYATQSWANTETGDGRRIQAAWMRGSDFPDMPFNQEISFPCELTLRTTPAGPRVYREPIHEISLLHDGKKSWSKHHLGLGEVLSLDADGELLHIKAEVDIPAGSKLSFNIRGETVTLGTREVQNGSSHGQTFDDIKQVEILIDRASIEVWVNHGEISSTRFVLPKGTGTSVNAVGAPVVLKSLQVYKLKSIWQKKS